MRTTLRLLALTAGIGVLPLAVGGGRAQLLITGNDEKVSLDGNTGKTILRLGGDALIKIGSLAPPGHPASMRGSMP